MTDDKPGRIVSYDEDGAPIRQMVPEIACTCKCAPEEHGPNGCKTWYGDKNTGFRCNCDWRPGQDKMLRSTHQDRLALDCGRLIIEKLKDRLRLADCTIVDLLVWVEEEIRQEIAQIILKNGFEKL